MKDKTKQNQEENLLMDVDDYIIQQCYRKKKSVKIEIRKGKFKASDNKYHSCLVAIFDNKYIYEDFATECFEGDKFDKLVKKEKQK